MKLLAVDTSASVLSAAVCRDDKIYSEKAEAGTRHCELVMDLIDSLMNKASLEPQDLQGVLCAAGPGSFTGLRIGYSIAKSLALALSIPFAPVPTLDCIAGAAINRETGKIIMPVIQARKDSFFYAFFNDEKRLTEDKEAFADGIEEEIRKISCCIENNSADEIILTGPSSDLLYNSLSVKNPSRIAIRLIDSCNMVYANEIIAIAIKRKLLDNDNTAFLFSGPDYLRQPAV